MKGIVAVAAVFVSAWILCADADSDSLGIKDVPGQKSEVAAVGLSLAATVVPVTAGIFVVNKGESEENDVGWGFWALVVPGITVGPSAGHFYANQWRRGLITTGVRLGILGAGIIAFNVVTSDDEGFLDNFGDALAVGGITTIALTVHALYDIAVAQESAKKYNESLRTSGKALLIPRIDPKDKGYGVSLVYSF